MLQLLSSAELRRVKLIELLLNNNNRISVKNAAKIIECSERIIDQDVIFFQENYAFISINRHKGIIILEIKPEQSPNEIYATLLSQSVAFRLLEIIFYQPYMFTEDILEQLDISQATLYRHLSQLKNVLSESFHIKLTTNPFQIKGGERSVRKFFSFFFRERYLGLYWPVDKISGEEIDSMIIYLRDEAHLLPSSVNIQEVRSWVYVNYIRSQQGFYMENDNYNQIFLDRVRRFADSDAFQKVYRRLPDELLAIDEAIVIHQMLYPFITEKTIFSHDDGINGVNPTFDKSLMLNVFELIRHLQTEFDVEIHQLSDFALNIYNARHIYQCIFEQSHIIYNARQPFFDHFAEYFPDFNRRLEELIVSKLFNNEDVSQCNMNNLKFIILSHWQDLTKQLMMNQPLKIGFISNQSFTFIQFHEKYFRNELPRYCDFEVWESYPLIAETINESDYDLIISNTMLPANVKKANIYIENIYSPKEMAKVLLAILETKKNQIRQKGAEAYASFTANQGK